LDIILTFVNQLTITNLAAHATPPTDAAIYLVDKDQWSSALKDVLQAGELNFVKQTIERDGRFVFLARPDQAIFVRLFKDDTNAAIASEETRLAGAEALSELLRYKFTAVTIHDRCAVPHALLYAEGMALASYQFLKYIHQPDKKRHSLRQIVVDAPQEAVAELTGIVEAVFEARTLVNEPFSYLTAPQLAEESLRLGQQHGFTVEVLGKEKIESLKMGGLLAVNQASPIPPQFIILEWIPIDPIHDQPVVLVGKGVVYDTGGYSIKPSEGMEYMKCDMAGAATVLGTFVAAAKNRLPVHLIGLIPATDNMVSGMGIVPGDIIRMASGKTVEVMNTDAEGRLILADALHYAGRYKPKLVVDFATLTGAAVRAVGNIAICYMGTAPEDAKRALEKSGTATYERLIEMPLWREYADELKSSCADMKNVGGPTAGAITAGKFLEAFAEGYPWLHLDIAGPAFAKAASGYKTREGTGVGVRLMYDFLKNLK
jgi:leucyl aminopeptidase